MSLNRSNARRTEPALPSYYGAQGSSPRDALSAARSKARAGPNRSTKASGKLKILPEEPEDGTHAGTSAVPETLQASHPTLADGIRRLPSGREWTGQKADDEDDDDEDDDSSEDDEEGDEQRAKISKQLELARIPEGSMRRDARRITRKGRATLPRVTAYSTATSYRMRELTKWLQARRATHRTNAMTFDECVYSTYSYDLVDQTRGMQGDQQQHHVAQSHLYTSNGKQNAFKSNRAVFGHDNETAKTGDLLGVPELKTQNVSQQAKPNVLIENRPSSNETAVTQALIELQADGEVDDPTHQRQHSDVNENRYDDEGHKQHQVELARREEARKRRRERFAVHGMVPEVFFMEYGTVVIWGMTLAEEKRLLRELRRFEVEKLAPEDVESEDLNWYLADYSRIYNDVITLRKGSSYMTKLSLSHALAQSTKISFFEGVIDNTIDTTKDIPQSIAESGKIGLPPVDIMKQIGHVR